jgi:hypothetical protein
MYCWLLARRMFGLQTAKTSVSEDDGCFCLASNTLGWVVPSFSRRELFLSHVTGDGQPFVAASLQVLDPTLSFTTTIHPGG